MSLNAESKPHSVFMMRLSRFTKDYIIILAILIMGAIISILSPYFLTYPNLRNILMQTSAIGIVAIGQGMIILTGDFDLSLGQNVCMTSCLAAWMMKFGGFDPWLSLFTAFAAGCLVGLCNGVLTSYARIPCFVVTLGFQMICRGFARIITNAAPIPRMPEQIQFLGRGFIGGSTYGIPISVVIMIVLQL